MEYNLDKPYDQYNHLERFIYRNEPAGLRDNRQFKKELADLLLDYVKASDLRKLVDELKRKRDSLWASDHVFNRYKGDGYDDCIDEIESLIKRSE